MEARDTLMRKSFTVLQEMSERKQRQQQINPMWTPPSSGKTISSKAGQAVREYYEKQAKEQLPSPTRSPYTPEVEELRKSFLMRPGCPRYSHRATSTSRLGNEITKVHLPCNISTISLSSQLSLEEWNMIFQRPDIFESKSYLKYCPASSTQSMLGLPKWRSFTEGFTGSGYPKSQILKGCRIPWYVSLLQEKDTTLQKMEAELVRLANCEAESIRKDDVISVLREELEVMQMQLDQAQQGGEITPVEVPVPKELEEKIMRQVSDPNLRRRGVSLPVLMQQKSIPEDFRQELERLKMELAQSDRQVDSKVELLSKTLLKDQNELEQLEKEYSEIQEKVRTEGEEEMRVESGSYEEMHMEESDEELLFIKLLEFQRMNDELYDELEKVKSDYDMATGAISSLQRELSFEASQLRKAHAERELLQKELRERGAQLEAMSNKFSNLREERKHEEMMGSIERENYKLRQDLTDLESKLTDKSQMIDDLQSNVNRLQAELLLNQHHVGNQLSQQNDLQRQLEILQRAEQQTRVILESISARFERFRSRIIQATYSTPGTKSPQAEITDDEVLESLQKIITDRLDFYQLLKQKGVKVPALGAAEPPPPVTPTSKKKSSSR
ncbi:coiled-coil domain-containing protein 27 [Zootoca vivipara]|uniref:coiled-coil domain-containing protein 27 n=1 Tax=Zootoca vivipara TaxID=8524 RepID=UPI0015913168|nr:coiled-coil domain-containing protein 27 isoform X2 [Zootoca vivipara]XP_060132140.1 coiled-coil domain-containing protein 27 [Zootoca vivipara]XP_060132141.1 coiled-coil domain-containing protein 27 [Zootoca vivipara]